MNWYNGIKTSSKAISVDKDIKEQLLSLSKSIYPLVLKQKENNTDQVQFIADASLINPLTNRLKNIRIYLLYKEDSAPAWHKYTEEASNIFQGP